MNSIALIMPYYGKYPNYFYLWLKSASFNNTIDFYIVTDIKDNIDYPNNVHVIDISFNDLKKKIQNLFDFAIKLDIPYKLCDYEPAYGLIFYEVFREYDFWGHCNLDVIWGDLRNFLKDEVLNSNEKIYPYAHLSIYKNNDFNRNAFKKMHHINVPTYEQSFTSKRICHFDEWGGISYLYKINKINFYETIDFADINFKYFHFQLAEHEREDGNLKMFYWEEGKLYGYYKYNNNIIKKEFSYIHLQKRPMKNEVKITGNSFAIVPNKFMPFHGEITNEFILKNCKKKLIYVDYLKTKFMVMLKGINNGGIKRKYIKCLKFIKKFFR
jgi:hypothetical protein